MDKVQEYAEENIAIFHLQRLEFVSKKVNFNKLLEQKNPYLFKAKNILTAHDLVKGFVDAYLQSQEETLFGAFLEGLAFFVCNEIFGAVKLEKGTGMDFMFEKNNIIYVIECKSGWNWGNSSQIKQLKINAKNIKTKLEKELNKNVVVVNGCCFGKKKNSKPEEDGYYKMCGQEFWFLISDDDKLFMKIIEPIGHKAKEKNEEFDIAYAALINNFTVEFAKKYCIKGIIDWEKLLIFNSGRKENIGVI
jgi:hypothetical protein